MGSRAAAMPSDCFPMRRCHVRVPWAGSEPASATHRRLWRAFTHHDCLIADRHYGAPSACVARDALTPHSRRRCRGASWGLLRRRSTSYSARRNTKTASPRLISLRQTSRCVLLPPASLPHAACTDFRTKAKLPDRFRAPDLFPHTSQHLFWPAEAKKRGVRISPKSAS